MKSLFDLWQQTSIELGVLCDVCTSRDAKTVAARSKLEGFSFLTITLPNFGKDLEKGLDRGEVGNDLFVGFKRRGGLPRFLGGFLCRIFDRRTGVLLENPCRDSIYAIRQLTLMFGKISLPCSDARNEKALRGFLECEQEVRRSDRTLQSPESAAMLSSFDRLTLLLFGDVLAEVDRAVYNGELIPKHGSGYTADGLRGNAKFDQTEWTQRLEAVFPYGDYCLPNWRYNYRLDATRFLEPGQERPVKVTLVPKTLKTPRIIAQEPTCMQYMQQAVMERLVEFLEKDTILDGKIGFLDQTPNRELAQEGSLTGRLATIDLSEASDRVSNQHVRRMLRHFPNLSEAVDATRSRKADVPGHGVIRLAKFASMGSALCFPIEAMVFLTIVFVGIEQRIGRQLSRKDLKSYSGSVRVYGDDIIVPVDSMERVISSLTAFGLKVNTDKSFGTGKFRESCGREYYNGADVSIVRVRHVFPSKLADATEVGAVVDLRNRLYEAGLWSTARWMDNEISPLLRGKYPYVSPDSPALGKVSYLGYDSEMLHKDWQTPMVKAFVLRSRIPDSKISGEGALVKWFLKRGDEPFADRDHLVRSGRPDAVYTKLRWARSV